MQFRVARARIRQAARSARTTHGSIITKAYQIWSLAYGLRLFITFTAIPTYNPRFLSQRNPNCGAQARIYGYVGENRGSDSHLQGS